MTAPEWARRVREAYGGAPDPGHASGSGHAADPGHASGSGHAATVHEAFGLLNVDVAASDWVAAATVARDGLHCTFFDWLSAVDEGDEGFRVLCHLAHRAPGALDHLLLGTSLPRAAPAVASLAGVFAGARWHERETFEMFGVAFTAGDVVLELEGLLLPAEFEGHPLRKDFVLASRVAVPWPGAKEPGESDASPPPSRGRRRTTPPGVPDPDDWGPRPSTPPVQPVEAPRGGAGR